MNPNRLWNRSVLRLERLEGRDCPSALGPEHTLPVAALTHSEHALAALVRMDGAPALGLKDKVHVSGQGMAKHEEKESPAADKFAQSEDADTTGGLGNHENARGPKAVPPAKVESSPASTSRAPSIQSAESSDGTTAPPTSGEAPAARPVAHLLVAGPSESPVASAPSSEAATVAEPTAPLPPASAVLGAPAILPTAGPAVAAAVAPTAAAAAANAVLAGAAAAGIGGLAGAIAAVGPQAIPEQPTPKEIDLLIGPGSADALAGTVQPRLARGAGLTADQALAVPTGDPSPAVLVIQKMLDRLGGLTRHATPPTNWRIWGPTIGLLALALGAGAWAWFRARQRREAAHDLLARSRWFPRLTGLGRWPS